MALKGPLASSVLSLSPLTAYGMTFMGLNINISIKAPVMGELTGKGRYSPIQLNGDIFTFAIRVIIINAILFIVTNKSLCLSLFFIVRPWLRRACTHLQVST